MQPYLQVNFTVSSCRGRLPCNSCLAHKARRPPLQACDNLFRHTSDRSYFPRCWLVVAVCAHLCHCHCRSRPIFFGSFYSGTVRFHDAIVCPDHRVVWVPGIYPAGYGKRSRGSRQQMAPSRHSRWQVGRGPPVLCSGPLVLECRPGRISGIPLSR